jgi:hypothetical protein
MNYPAVIENPLLKKIRERNEPAKSKLHRFDEFSHRWLFKLRTAQNMPLVKASSPFHWNCGHYSEYSSDHSAPTTAVVSTEVFSHF